MTFNPLEEKGLDLDKQIRTWHEITKIPFNKTNVDCYTRTRQILMNGIEIEAWGFKHLFSRISLDEETKGLISQIRRIEDMQQTTVNWLTPSDQNVLETTLGYEQVAVELTAWLAQNEPDEYVKETFDFGLLEDFDHLYRYSQWAYLEHGISPNSIVQNKTDIIIGRPTQYHHNCNKVRLRKPYDKNTVTPQTRVNICTLVSAEQQTHNYYAEHGMDYGNQCIRETYAEIKDVEEEHVTMYESLIDPTESLYEKLLIHEFTEVCNYYTCMEDEVDTRLKKLWELFLDYELGHLQIAAKLFEKNENRDAEEIIGTKILIPNKFKSQKDYVTKILENEVSKRLTGEMGYMDKKDITENWGSYPVQKALNSEGSPSERVIKIISAAKGKNLVIAEKSLKNKESELLKRGLQDMPQAPDTVTVEELKEMQKEKDFDFECN